MTRPVEKSEAVAAATAPAEPAYEAPAITWEEDFEPLQAGSLMAPNGPNQMSELQGCNIL